MNLKTKIKKKGFTLVELLIVIAIIAILATLAIMSYRGAKVKAKDTKRDYDVSQVAKAFEMYYYKVGVFPSEGDVTNLEGFLESGDEIISPEGEVYMRQMPAPPSKDGVCTTEENNYGYTRPSNRCIAISYCTAENGVSVYPVGDCSSFAWPVGSIVVGGGAGSGSVGGGGSVAACIPSSCSSGETCSGGTCLSCDDDDDCTVNRVIDGVCNYDEYVVDGGTCSGGAGCSSGECVACINDDDCGSEFCNSVGECVACLTYENCTGGDQYCDDEGSCRNCKMSNLYPEDGALIDLNDYQYLSVTYHDDCGSPGRDWAILRGETDSEGVYFGFDDSFVEISFAAIEARLAGFSFEKGKNYRWKHGPYADLEGNASSSELTSFTTVCENDTHCDDGWGCTEDSCEGSGYCSNISNCADLWCYEDACMECSENIHCDDDSSCTEDVCSRGYCVNTLLSVNSSCIEEIGYCNAVGDCHECIDDRHCDVFGETCGIDNICAIGCGTDITEPGTIILQEDLVCGGEPGFRLQSNNITIDCAGHSISGDRSMDGISVTPRAPLASVSDFVIRDCDIHDFRTGISLHKLDSGLISGVNVYNNRVRGLYSPDVGNSVDSVLVENSVFCGNTTNIFIDGVDIINETNNICNSTTANFICENSCP